MRILLDENLDWRLMRHLPGHQVDTVAYIGWSGMKNGLLLEEAVAAGYEVLITMDFNMPYQQNLTNQPIAVIALRAPCNRLADTAPLMSVVLECLPTLSPGSVIRIG